MHDERASPGRLSLGGADEYDGVAIERGIAAKHSTYPEFVSSDQVKFLVLACEEGGRWSPDVYRVVKDLVDFKTAPLHPLLRRSAAQAYTKRWWGILSVGAQTANIDCILGQDSPVTLQGQDPPLATVFQWAGLEPEPSRLR